jgi:O-methyltransferase involved in polyketide biosynthesis
MSRDTYFQPPDSYVREKPEWTKQTPAHIADFLARGGTITVLQHGDSFYAKHYTSGAKHAFVINPAKARGQNAK